MQEDFEEWPRALSRRDAGAYVRAVKRYGLEQRLPEIAADVGASLEAAPEAAQCAPLADSSNPLAATAAHRIVARARMQATLGCMVHGAPRRHVRKSIYIFCI